MSYCNLHVHSEGSFLDGYSPVGQIARRVRELGQEAVALTDHGDCGQHLAFQKACRAEGIKAVMGMEGYFVPDIEAARNQTNAKGHRVYPDRHISHICLIASDQQGLRNLWALSSTAYDKVHHHYKPLADPALLRQYAEGIYASDGCFIGSERFCTLGGTRTFKETVGTTQKVLGQDGCGSLWTDAEIKSFGVQRLVELTVSRDGYQKIIKTTANHRWIIPGRNGSVLERLTSGLRSGDVLKSLAPPVFTGRTVPSAVGIQAGIVFGDGTVDVGDTGRRSARVKLYGSKDAQLLKWFPLQPTTACRTEDAIEVRGLPGYFKDAPSLTDSAFGYLHGWLAGYFAADGCVTRKGSAQLASARIEDVQLVRDVCLLLGVRTGPIRTVNRIAPLPQGGFSDNALYYVTLDVTHLHRDFFLIDMHRERVEARRSRTRQEWSSWRVVSVEETDRFEEVFCAVVPRGNAFVLEDDILTGNCMITGFGRAVEAGDEDGARQYLATLQDIFGDRFYSELHTWQFMEEPTGEKDRYLQKLMTQINQAKVRLATEMGIPMVVVTDSHHAYPQDWQLRELVCQFKRDDNPDQQGLGGQKADHLMDLSELDYWMDRHGVSSSVIEEAIRNSGDIAEACNTEITPMLSMPKFTRSEAEDFDLFLDKVEAGFKRRVIDGGLPQETYWRRMESEVSLIAEKRFAGYFLMVEDYARAARSGTWAQYVLGTDPQPMDIGPGRGSVGGSLVAWLLDITSIDPVKYGTMFERFLSPGRKGFPDIDIDFPKSKQPFMKRYMQHRWGEDHVCSICTMTRNQAKGTVNDLARALGVNYTDGQKISKLIEEYSRSGVEEESSAEDIEISWEEIAERDKTGELAGWVRQYPELFDKLARLTGIIRQTGVHAAAVLVSDSEEPLAQVLPTRVKNNTLTTQFDMYDIEELGGLKADFLALRHLDALQIARDLVKQRHGVDIDYETFGDEQYGDPAIWAQIDDGQTTGIFQLGTSGGTDSAIEFRPRSMVDVADLISINRPGVRDAGLYHAYLRRRAGVEPVSYDHPLMEPIVGDTYGILIYQEQLIRTVRELAGFTADEADDLRKAVGKKIMEKVVALKGKFIQGCQDNYDYALACGDPANQTLNEEKERHVAERIWASIEASGRYLFNKSHAIGYAMITSRETWMKHYYPIEMLVGFLRVDEERRNQYIRDARRRSIAILAPDLNASEQTFTIEADAIRYGLQAVRGVGDAAAKAIVAAQPYKSLSDYLGRARKGANKTVAINLVKIGALDCLGDRASLLREIEQVRITEDLAKSTLGNPEKLEKVLSRRQSDHPDRWSIEIPDFSDDNVVYAIEQELIGSFVTIDPMAPYLKAIDTNAIRSPAVLRRYRPGQQLIVGGQIVKVRENVVKRGRQAGQVMCFLGVQWQGDEYDITVWPRVYDKYKLLLVPDAPVLCGCERTDRGVSLVQLWRLDLVWQDEG
jgi:DNA polymerase-3 subunit alpha